MLNSTRRSISYPNPDRSDRPDISAHILNLVNKLDLDVVYDQGTNAARIAAAHQASGGRFWWTTDTKVLYYDDGTNWQLVSATELDYAQITAPVTIVGTTEATATTIVPGNSVTYDGTRILIECWAGSCDKNNGDDGDNCYGILLMDGVVLGQFHMGAGGFIGGYGSWQYGNPQFSYFYTPTAAAHTFTWKGWSNRGGTGGWIIRAGAGGTPNIYTPAFIRVRRA